MNTSLFLQCFIFLDLVGWSREKCLKKPWARDRRGSLDERSTPGRFRISPSRPWMVMADGCDVEVIVKLGGCAVTQKNTFETVKHDAILAAAKLVKQINGKCIVIHGAG